MGKKGRFSFQVGVGTKITIPILLVVAIFSFPAVMAWRGMQDVQQKNASVQEQTRALVVVRQMEAALQDELDASRDLDLTNADLVAAKARDAQHRANRLDVLGQAIDSDPEAGWLADLRSLNDRSAALLASAADPASLADRDELAGQLAGVYESINDVYASFTAHLESRENESVLASNNASEELARNVIFTLFITGTLGLCVGFVLTRHIVNPVSKLARTARDLSRGELHKRVAIGGRDELAELGEAFNNMAASLQTRTEALIKEQSKLTSVHQSIVDGILVFGSNGFIVSANPAAVDILKKSESSLAGSRQTGILELDEAIARGIDSRISIDAEIDNRSLSISLAPILNDAAKSEGLLAVIHDVTNDRYRAKQLQLLYEIVNTIASKSIKESLQESLELCISAMNASSGSIMLLEEGETLVILAHKGLREDVAGHRQHLGEGIAGWVAQQGEPLLLTRDNPDPRFSGMRNLRDAVCLPIRDEQGVIGVLSLNERKTGGGFTLENLDFLAPVAVQMGMALSRARLHEKVVEEKEKTTAIVECMGESLCVRAPDRTILFANSAYKQIFGDECIGKSCYEIYVGRNSICRGCPLDRCIEQGTTVRRTHFVLDKLGNQRQVEMTASPIRDALGNISSIIEISRDVTEMLKIRNQAESRLVTLTTLFEVSNTLSSSLELKHIVENFVKSAQHAMRATTASVMLLEESKRQLVVEAISGETEGWNAEVGNAIDISAKGLGEIASGSGPLCFSSASRKEPWFSLLAPPVSQSVIIGRLTSRGRLLGLISVSSVKRAAFSEPNQMELFMDITNQAAVAVDNAAMFRKLESTFWSIIRSLAEAIDAKDSYTRGHSDRVADYAEALARRLELDDEMLDAVRCAGYLHDTGKIGIPDSILLKPGRLSEEEYSQIMNHPILSHKIIEPVEFPFDVKPLVRHHHERIDGSGYPDGLKGEEIPIGARIIGIADAFEAMTSDRPYRTALSVEEAAEELKRCAGTQFDAELVEEFLRMLFPAALKV